MTDGKVLGHDGQTLASPPANTSRNDRPVQPGETRQAEHYWGLKGIDWAGQRSESCNSGKVHIAGWHQGDLAEYLVNFPSASQTYTLNVIGIPDDPKPVKVNVYIDGDYYGQIEWNDSNPRCNEGQGGGSQKISIRGYQGTHAVAFEFANDWNTPCTPWRDNCDRNFFFDYFKVEGGGTPPVQPPSGTAALHVINGSSAGGIWEGLWVTHCLGNGTQRVWQINSSREWADYRGTESQKDCGSQGNSGIYPLVFRDSTVDAGTWITWCTGSNGDQWVWRSDGTWKYVPFQYPEKGAGCP